jgi:hypothetical protein
MGEAYDHGKSVAIRTNGERPVKAFIRAEYRIAFSLPVLESGFPIIPPAEAFDAPGTGSKHPKWKELKKMLES